MLITLSDLNLLGIVMITLAVGTLVGHALGYSKAKRAANK